ncbi:metal-dependent hydrolase [Patescibacteria group bacterium]
MVARTHDAFAFSSLVTLSVIFPPNRLNVLTIFACIIGNIIGSLIPDIDQAGNRLWDLLPAGNLIGKFARKIFYKHRTLTHSLLGAFLVFLLLQTVLPKLFNPVYVDSNLLLWSIMIGYGSHLFSDMLTKEGLPLFFPLNLNIGIPPFEFLRITTGKWVENYVVLPAVSIYLLCFIFVFQSDIANILRLVQ